MQKKHLSLRGIFSETMLASFPWPQYSMAQNDWFLTNKVLPERKALMKWIFRPSSFCLWLPLNFPHVCWLPLELIDKCVYFAKTRGENTHFLHKLFRLLATNSRMLCHTIVVRVVLHWVMNSRERWWCIHHQISDHGWLRAMFDKWN